MRKPVLFIVGALLLAQAEGRTVCRAAEGPAPQPYTRVANPDSNTVQLQIALRKFVPAQGAGPAIWLAGVMHVGEPAYYHALQEFLDAQTVVLYEGINPGAHPHHVGDGTAAGATGAGDGRDRSPPTAAGTNSDYSMQSALARCLGLVFQLEAIDYDRTNFLNSDLSIRQIQRIMAGGWTDGRTRRGRPGQCVVRDAAANHGREFLSRLAVQGGDGNHREQSGAARGGEADVDRSGGTAEGGFDRSARHAAGLETADPGSH